MAKKNSAQTTIENPPAKSRNQLFGYFIVFVFGFLAGVAFTIYKMDSVPQAGTPSETATTASNSSELKEAILNLEAKVTASPDDYQAWVRLGHLYYDTDQPQKAISAYTRSLELHSGDANLITDLGVMFRRTNQPQKAIDSFNTAMKMDPTHLPSRFNKGIVLMYDLDDPQGAIASWEELLRLNPQAKTANGQPMSDFIASIKRDLENRQ